MNWENSKALTPLKRNFIRQFFAMERSFFLTGGSALGIFYLEHRRSYDLDFFTERDVDWHLLGNIVRDCSLAVSAQCETITASPLFYRFQLSRGPDRELLDFVVEHTPQVNPTKEDFGPVRVDTLHEIAVNKVCMLISRCELKDVVDLYFLANHGLDILALFPDARKKEGGLDPAMISFLLAQLRIDSLPDYLIAPLDLDEFRAFVLNLRKRLAAMSLPE